ncbi:hypothetical protein FPV67DRAFT_1443193 [Lyophyllum atratum]|nr:hypothetical protein FPV67DRAFT_1443193 [Lyophyllum atratum]
MALTYQDLSAWIMMDGKIQQVYAVDTPRPNSITCWIASESGKKFSVNWRNLSRSFPLQGTVAIDGVACDTHIMLDAPSFPDRPNAVGVSYARTSECTRRDFMFAAIEVTDDDAYLHTADQTYNFGTITLELWRLYVSNVVSKPFKHHPGNPVLESQLVHERSKKAGTHHVKYSEEYYSPAPVVDVVTAHKWDSFPYVNFTFKYRPLAMLMANGIVPRPIPTADQGTAAEIRALEAKLAVLRSKAGSSSGAAWLPHRKIKNEPGMARRGLKPLRKGLHKNQPEIIDLTDD